MKIKYITNSRIPTEKAHGVQIMKMCEAFSAIGNEVELVVPNRKNQIKEGAFDYFKVKENFKIKYVWCLDFVRFGFVGFLTEGLTYSLSVMFREFFSRDTFYFGRDYQSLLLLSIFGKKTFWETHTGEWNILVKILLKLSNGVISISQGLKEFYVSKGINPEKIIVAHDGADLIIKSDGTNPFPSDDKVKVLYTGKIGGWKGVETLLESSKKITEAKVFIVGGDSGQVEELSKIYPAVSFLGRKSHAETINIQSKADILVIPNTGRDKISVSYTSPLKVFEYMAAGKPIVASDLPSIREVLNESNAFFATPDDPNSFAEVIEYVVSNKEEAEKRAKRAFEDVQKYTWKSRAESIASFMNSK